MDRAEFLDALSPVMRQEPAPDRSPSPDGHDPADRPETTLKQEFGVHVRDLSVGVTPAGTDRAVSTARRASIEDTSEEETDGSVTGRPHLEPWSKTTAWRSRACG